MRIAEDIKSEGGAAPAIKILALFTLAVTAILSDSWWVLGSLLAIPVLWWVAHGKNPLLLVPMLRRTWVFLFFLLISFLIVPPETPDPLEIEVAGAVIDVSGLMIGARMCIRLLTIILASLVLRETGRPREILLGLRQLRLPLPVAQTIDATLTLVAAQRTGRGGGRRRRKEKRRARRAADGPRPSLAERRRALAERLASSFHETISRSAAQVGSPSDEGVTHISAASDVVVVTALVVMVMGLKLVKILPGIPLASGNKLMLIIPLYFVAARYTRSRIGATWMGVTLGVVSFLFGEGRFGILEIAKYVAAGVVLDLLWPVIRQRSNVVVASIVGLLMGIGWFASTLLAAWVASAPPIFYALAGVMAISQFAFSFLSGPVTWGLLRALDRPIAPKQSEAELVEETDQHHAVGSGSGAGTGGGRKQAQVPE